MTNRYEVTLSDGHCFAVVEVEASSVDSACEMALDMARNENITCDEPFESNGRPDYIDAVARHNTNNTVVWENVPLDYVRLPSEVEWTMEHLIVAKQMVAKGHAEEAIMALENIPGLKGLGDLVRGVR